MKALIASAIVATLLLAGVLALVPGSLALTARPGAYVDEIVFFAQPDQSKAILDIKSGAMDMYIFPLRKITDINAAKNDADLTTISTAGSLNNMLFNPVPTDQSKVPGSLNPFTSREVREGMNYLINRRAIADQLFGGAAMPHTSLFVSQSAEFAREAVFMGALDRKYSYNPDTAKQLIESGMARLGASFQAGKWTFQGAPVNINLARRIEDTRFEIGAYVADQLRSAGFDVTLIDIDAVTANAMVYSGPPDITCSKCTKGAWHAYTEGWAQTALSAWNDDTPLFYYNGDFDSAIWTLYKLKDFPAGSPERQLDDVTNKLQLSNYATLEERQQLMRQAVDLGMKNSVRVFMVAGAVFASSKRVQGFVYDLSGGSWGIHALRTARFASEGGTLRVGQPTHFTSPWNPWRGFTFLYDATQGRTIRDYGVWPHPHTGLNIPIRADFQVITAGPSGKLDVPSSAILWNNTAAGYQPVGGGVKAASRVTFTYTFGKWHDGSEMNMNDVLHQISLWRRFEPKGDIGPFDRLARSAGVTLFNQVVRAVRVTSPTTLEIYADYWHIDATTIAGVVDAFPNVPWHVSELAMATVLGNQTKISATTADSVKKTRLDLSKGDTLGFMDGYLPPFTTDNHKAPGFSTLISDAEATARWANVKAWKTARGHFLVSNGPFYLQTVDVANKQSVMRVVNTANLGYDYPFMSDRWDSILNPRKPEVSIQTPPQVVLGTGLPTNISVRTTLGASPYDNLDMNWLVSSPTGTVLFSGTAVKASAGLFTVTMSPGQIAVLSPGAYTLTTITVGREAAVPVTTTASFVAISSLTLFETRLGTETAKLRGDIQTLQGDLAAARTQATNAQNLANTLLIVIAIAIVVAVLAIAVSVVSIRSFNRRFAQLSSTMGAMPAQMEEHRP